MQHEIMPLTAEEQKKLQQRLRRVAGQLAALERALGRPIAIDPFLQQLSAVNGATKALMLAVIELHIHQATASALALSSAPPAAMAARVLRYMKQS